MTVFKIYDCTFGFTRAGVSYEFDHVDSVEIEDPERLTKTRGANKANKRGITYRTGTKDPKRFVISTIDIPKEIFDLLNVVHDDEEEIDAWAIGSDGSSVYANFAVLSNKPRQLVIDDTAESMNVALEFETFDLVQSNR